MADLDARSQCLVTFVVPLNLLNFGRAMCHHQAMRRPRLLLLAVVAVVAISSCGSDDAAECLTSDVGEVCAEKSDGSTKFSGNGLQPDSAVLIEHSETGLSVYEVGDDGTFELADGGVVSLTGDTSSAFAVTATDADGQLIAGEITIES